MRMRGKTKGGETEDGPGRGEEKPLRSLDENLLSKLQWEAFSMGFRWIFTVYPTGKFIGWEIRMDLDQRYLLYTQYRIRILTGVTGLLLN